MDITAWLYPRVARALARWGELGCEDLLEMSLHEAVAEVPPVAGITMRLARAADIDEIIRLYAADPWLYLGETPSAIDDRVRELYLDRLRRGEECFLAMSGELIAHANWSCYTWGDVLPEHPLRLRPGEVYTTDAVTVPTFRGRGLHAMVLRAMLDHARSCGLRWAYTLARVDRHATYKALYQVGYRKRGRLIYYLPKGVHRSRILSRQGDLEPLFRPE